MRREGSTSSSSITSSLHCHHNGGHPTDLRLGLGLSSSQPADLSASVSSEAGRPAVKYHGKKKSTEEEINESSSSGGGGGATFFVKVYMEGIPIGRKLDLLAHDGYQDLIITLDHMFNTNILWAEMVCENFEQSHVLTYEDKEGDWLIVGDVPWEMFLSSVRRLKITRADI